MFSQKFHQYPCSAEWSRFPLFPVLAYCHQQFQGPFFKAPLPSLTASFLGGKPCEDSFSPPILEQYFLFLYRNMSTSKYRTEKQTGNSSSEKID